MFHIHNVVIKNKPGQRYLDKELSNVLMACRIPAGDPLTRFYHRQSSVKGISVHRHLVYETGPNEKIKRDPDEEILDVAEEWEGYGGGSTQNRFRNSIARGSRKRKVFIGRTLLAQQGGVVIKTEGNYS